MTRPRCKGTRKNGQPCRAWAMTDGVGYCLTHDPNINERRCPWPTGDGSHGYSEAEGIGCCGYQSLHTSPYCLLHTRQVMASDRTAAARFEAGEELYPNWR